MSSWWAAPAYSSRAAPASSAKGVLRSRPLSIHPRAPPSVADASAATARSAGPPRMKQVSLVGQAWVPASAIAFRHSGPYMSGPYMACTLGFFCLHDLGQMMRLTRCWPSGKKLEGRQ